MTVFWEGRPVAAQPGQSLAAALWAAGVRDLAGEAEMARGLYCGVGHCFACRIAVDGIHGVRACLIPVREGMRAGAEPGDQGDAGGSAGGSVGAGGLGASGQPGVAAAPQGDGAGPPVAVLGAGPAGLAAAAVLAEAGAQVSVLDEAPEPGGALRLVDPQRAADLAARATAAGARILCGTSVWGVYPGWRLLLAPAGPGAAGAPAELAADALILATGAVQRPLAMPGWTLPGVVAPWAALHLLRAGALEPGTRVAAVGSDPATGLAVERLRAAGLDVVAVLRPRPSPLVPQAYALAAVDSAPQHDRLGIAFLGGRRLEGVRTCAPDGTGQADVAVDLAVAGTGLSPLTDAAQLAGATVAAVEALGGFVALHGPAMESRAPRLFVAGAVTGAEGAEVAEAQGRVAGLACAAACGLLGAGPGVHARRTAAAADLDAAHARAAARHPSAAVGRAEIARRWAAQLPGTP